MIPKTKLLLFVAFAVTMASCVSKKQFLQVQTDLATANKDLGKAGEKINDYMKRVATCEQEKEKLKGELKANESALKLRQEQIQDLKEQVTDTRTQRDKQVQQVGDLTVLSQSANNNIKETLTQLEGKDKYIKLLQAAKTKADSINLALAVNLKGVLSDGVADKDVEIKVDKTVVFINLSDKMLYQIGSATITPKANEVLGKIAKIIESKPDLEVMVEGYTDNLPINKPCFEDNWDLSAKRATAVVRVLQKTFKIDPNKLIAAARSEYNTLASNDTLEGRAINRRTRIIIMPKLNQFYDLLNPANAVKK
jgi:chemotaxis protein MotB